MRGQILQSSDRELRDALHRKVLKDHHLCPSTVVVDELGLAHGKIRVDVAVLNGYLHGYEIKSSKDNLSRFTNQLHEYQKCFQKLTIIAAPNHIGDVSCAVPAWCGIIEARKGPRGGISFATIRKSQLNPKVDSLALAHLLWRKEAIELLNRFGKTQKELSAPRKRLYEMIASETSSTELVSWIKEKFTEREAWRSDLRRM
jgi:hypothetical protein